MHLVHVSHDDGYWSKSLCGTFPIPVHDLKVKVTALEVLCKSFVLKFCVKVFTLFVFAYPLMDLIHVWYSDWFICILVHEPKVKVTDIIFM